MSRARTAFTKFRRVGALLVAMAVLAPLTANAATIVIFNTGVSAEGTVDPNYRLIGSASNPGCSAVTPCNAFVAVTDGWPITPGVWLANNAMSRWIQPNSATDDTPAEGNYTYRTTFDLTGFDPATASLTGQWATDNLGLNILINGIPTGQTNNAQFTSWTPFSISSGFIPGVNTLDFVLNNATGPGGNPSGLRVEASGTVQQMTPVPEPGTFALMATGLAWAAARRRRRNGER